MHRLSCLLFILAIPLAGCGPTKATSTAKLPIPGSTAPVNIGADLYAKAPMPTIAQREMGPESLIVPQGVIQFDLKIQVPSEVDGRIELVAIPLPEGTKFDPTNPLHVRHPRDPSLVYKRISDTEPIKDGQTLVRIDETQIVIQIEALNKSLVSMKLAITASEDVVKGKEEVLRRFKSSPQSSPLELANAEVEVAQAKKQLADVVRDQAKFDGDLLIAKSKLDQYFIRSRVDGRVLKLLKSPGEYIKAGEPLLEVQATNRFRVEAKLEVQEANRLRPGMPVIVEPARPISPEPYSYRHRQEVTGVAVTAHKGRPLVVSTSLDSTAIVWDLTSTAKKKTILVHPAGVGVKCVATTGTKAGTLYYAATGGSDGKIRLWDLANPDALPETPLGEFEEAHGSPITAIDFSPDGSTIATAAGREVFVWDVATRKKKYALPTDFRDDVTTVKFTPQCTLVTACRDKTVRIYNLGTVAASLTRNIENRAGTVDLLGVSSDGGRMLIDTDPTHIDVIDLNNTSIVQSLQNAGGNRFSGLALFNSDDKYAITAAGDSDTKGELQLWQLPTNNPRAAERRRLVTPGRSPVTCAAFSPETTNGFVAVGTQSGGVYFWSASTVLAESAEWKGVIVAITDVDSRTSQVRVEVENPSGSAVDVLQDRGLATLIIDRTAPLQKVPAPVAPVAPMKLPPNLQSQGPKTLPDPLNPGGVITVGATEVMREPPAFVVPVIRTPPPIGIDPFRLTAPVPRPAPEK